MDKVNQIPRQRLAMVIEFDGCRFHGWQRQDNAFTVQQAIEDALKIIEGEYSAPGLATAGRTDSGVHATHMLIHGNVDRSRWLKSPQAYMKGLNHFLNRQGVVIHGIKEVSDQFQARYDCFERRYQYKIWNRPVSSVLYEKQAWWVPQSLDIDSMNRAAISILGERDFTTFRASGCQSNSTMRELKRLEASKQGHMLTIDVEADAFLYHMVRNLVGTLVAIGTGRWQPEYMLELLNTRNRCLAAATAPAHGLYFTDALYPDFSAQQISGMLG